MFSACQAYAVHRARDQSMTHQSEAAGISPPLSGLRVIELARVLAGPWAGQMLADLGADVIKVERPDSGDETRAWGPPFVATVEGAQPESAYFHCCNRGKRSMVVDLTTPRGQEIL